MVTQVTSEEAPRWETLELQLLCPRCGYDVRWLSAPRCPECGLEFQWPDLISAAEHRANGSDWEGQWRHRPARSFWVAVGRAMFPPWGWRHIPLLARPRLLPPILLGSLALTLYAAVARVCNYLFHWYALWYSYTYRGQRNIGWSLLWLSWSGFLQEILGLAVLAVLLMVATIVFWQTLVGRKVTIAHLVRVAAFAWVGFVGWRIISTVLLTGIAAISMQARGKPLIEDWPWRAADLVQWTALIVGYCCGFTIYLRWKMGWVYALLSLTVLLVLLVLTTIMVVVGVYGSMSNPWLTCIEIVSPAARLFIESIIRQTLGA